MTLHNMALMNMEENPTQGFEKLQFLLQQVACPPGKWVGEGRRGSAVAHLYYLCTSCITHCRNFCQSPAALCQIRGTKGFHYV